MNRMWSVGVGGARTCACVFVYVHFVCTVEPIIQLKLPILSLYTYIQWNLSIKDTNGTQLAVLYTVEPLYRGYHWDPAGCPVYRGTSL